MWKFAEQADALGIKDIGSAAQRPSVQDALYGSTLRRLQAQFLNAYSTLPCPALQLKLVFVIERIRDLRT